MLLASLGFILLVSTWVLATILLVSLRHTKAPSISEHASSNRIASIVFAVVMVAFAILLEIWFRDWYAPKLYLGGGFLVVVAVALIAQVVTGLVPDLVGRRRQIHRLAAYIMAVSYLPLVAYILSSSQLSLAQQIFVGIVGLYMLVSFVVVVVFKIHFQYFLRYQIAFLLGLQVVLLITAYL